MNHILSRLWSRPAGESQRSLRQASTIGPARILPGPKGAEAGSDSLLENTLLIVALGGHVCNPLAHALDLAGYRTQTLTGLAEALACIERARPVLVIVCGPATSDTYQTLRRKASVSLLALLPESAKTDMLVAFSAGVDDCQLTSISKAETVARVRSMLRRGTQAPGEAG
jgi:DNA-binding response OmpR family regulator